MARTIPSVSIHTGPISAGMRAAEVPEEKWSLLLGAWGRFLESRLPFDCRELLRFVREAEEHKMWEKVGYPDLEALIRERLHLDSKAVAWAIDGLKTLRPEEAVSFSDAVSIGQKAAEAREDPSPKWGEIGRGRNRGDNIISNERGTGQTYTLRRLARDNPELLDRVETGELSPHAAAIEAGWAQAAGRHQAARHPQDAPVLVAQC